MSALIKMSLRKAECNGFFYASIYCLVQSQRLVSGDDNATAFSPTFTLRIDRCFYKLPKTFPFYITIHFRYYDIITQQKGKIKSHKSEYDRQSVITQTVFLIARPIKRFS